MPETAAAAELVIEVPRARAVALRAARQVGECTVLPTVLFALLLHADGLHVALWGALGWCYLAVAVRWATGGRVPALLLLSTALFTARTALVLATSSAGIYLLQPIVTSFGMGAVLLGGAVVGRPLTARLARDLLDLPHDAHAGLRRVLRDLAVIWGLFRVADALLTLQLVDRSAGSAIVARGIMSPAMNAATLIVCVAWATWRLRSDSVRLRWQARPALSPA